MAKENVNFGNVSSPLNLEKLLNKIVDQIDELTALANEIKTDYNAHTHEVGGVTSSGLSATVTADSVTEVIVQGK